LDLPVDVNQLAARVKLLLMDVDGVATDGRLYNVPGLDGKWPEQGLYSQDGIALQWLDWKGIKTGLISGRFTSYGRTCQADQPPVYQGPSRRFHPEESCTTKSMPAKPHTSATILPTSW
jgi:3-deoxy-D-manno-octulosonate 8-phosphate phosphatase (KDO 8-P phosphatase)